MEPNLCKINHLDGDVVLPPRKRLLAGLKRPSPDADGSLHLSLVASSPATPTPTYTPPSSPTMNEFNTRLSNLLRSYRCDLSAGEIAEASKSAAAAAREAAEVARAAAEDKAVIAARAVAAAKNALALVASFSEEPFSSRERRLRKNKFKKHVPVQLLYKRYQPIENCKKDEEIARKLHRAINSSPRITKNSSGSSDSKDRKHKKTKTSSTSSEKARVVLEQNHTSSSNGHAAAVVQVDF